MTGSNSKWTSLGILNYTSLQVVVVRTAASNRLVVIDTKDSR